VTNSQDAFYEATSTTAKLKNSSVEQDWISLTDTVFEAHHKCWDSEPPSIMTGLMITIQKFSRCLMIYIGLDERQEKQ